MSEPDDELQSYLDDLPRKVRAKLVDVIEEQANDLAAAIRDAAEQGQTGDLRESVRVEDGENDLERIVTAGGELTTTTSPTGWAYDYALANEFGTTKMPAHPFFWPTIHERREAIVQAISDAVDEAVGG